MNTITGIKAVDETIRLSDGITMVGAHINNGKTLLLLNMATKAAKNGKKVLYVSLEMSVSSVIGRVSNMKKVFRTKNSSRNIDKNLVIISYSNFSFNTLVETLENLKYMNKFIPDVIFIDHIDLMYRKDTTQEEYNPSKEALKLMTSLRHLCYRELSIVASHQLARDMEESSLVRRNMAESFHANCIITIKREKTDISDYTLNVLKSRYTVGGETIRMKCSPQLVLREVI